MHCHLRPSDVAPVVLGLNYEISIAPGYTNSIISQPRKTDNASISPYFRHIRSVLSDDMAKSVAVSLVSSRLDYTNSLLFGTSASNLHKLQRVQNTLAKIVLNNSAKIRYCSSAASLAPHQAAHLLQNCYCNIPLISLNTPSRTLRSASHNFIYVPFTSTAVGCEAFMYAAPTVWNSIPFNIRHKNVPFHPPRLVMFST